MHNPLPNNINLAMPKALQNPSLKKLSTSIISRIDKKRNASSFTTPFSINQATLHVTIRTSMLFVSIHVFTSIYQVSL